MLTNMTFQTFCVYYVGILHMYNLAIQQLYYMSANKVDGKRVGSSRRGFTYLTILWMVILNSRLAVRLYQNNKTFIWVLNLFILHTTTQSHFRSEKYEGESLVHSCCIFWHFSKTYVEISSTGGKSCIIFWPLYLSSTKSICCISYQWYWVQKYLLYFPHISGGK